VLITYLGGLGYIRRGIVKDLNKLSRRAEEVLLKTQWLECGVFGTLGLMTPPRSYGTPRCDNLAFIMKMEKATLTL
jgi:hypothetical protein